MQSRALLPAMAASLLIVLSGCQRMKEVARDRAINAAAVTFLQQTGPTTDAAWGLTDRRVFATGSYLGVQTIDDPVVSPLPESPRAFAVTRSLWVVGRDRDGREVKQQRRVVIKVVLGGDDDWRGETVRFTTVETLELGKQMVTWLGSTLVLFVCLAFFLFVNSSLNILGVVLFLGVTLPGAIYFSVDVFGTWASVLLTVPASCLLAVVCWLVALLLVATLKAALGLSSK
jgi:hypothetical protein